jgi:uncharacterized protein YoxC
MVDLNTLLTVCLYILGIILLIVLIVLGIKCIRILGKVDKLVDDVEVKVSSLDGLFNIVDKVTDGIVLASDSIISSGSDFISRLFRKKKEDDLDE